MCVSLQNIISVPLTSITRQMICILLDTGLLYTMCGRHGLPEVVMQIWIV